MEAESVINNDITTAESSLGPFTVASMDIRPMYGKYFHWNASQQSNVDGECVITFEGRAKDDIHVAISNASSYKDITELYEIVIGLHGNTETLVRKTRGSLTGAAAAAAAPAASEPTVLAQHFSGRVCREHEFRHYWVVIKDGIISVGVGSQVGKETLIKVRDESPLTGVRFVCFSSHRFGVKLRNISISNANDVDVENSVEHASSKIYAEEDGTELLSSAHREKYDAACEQARNRAARFKTMYQPPDMRAILDSTEIRRLQRSGGSDRGFVTGFDMLSKEEEEKRAKRMSRFQTTSFGVEFSTETSRALNSGVSDQEWKAQKEEQEKRKRRGEKFGTMDHDNSMMVDSVMTAVDLSSKVMKDRVDPKSDAQVRADGIHLFSLDENFQRVRTRDILSYFNGYGPSYVEWLNDSSCTVAFHDPHTASRALITLSAEIDAEMTFIPTEFKETNEDEHHKDHDGTLTTEPSADSMDVDAEVQKNTSSMETEDEVVAGVETTSSELLKPVGVAQAGWRWGLPITSSNNGANSGQKWRVLLRRATDGDFPPEKPMKNRRGVTRHNTGQNNRHRTAKSYRKRSHPYDETNNNSSSRRRRHGQQHQQQQSPPSEDEESFKERLNRSSKRVHVNEDGSISLKRD